MNRLYSILLLSVFLTYTFSQTAIILMYLSDVEGYTAKYCVNIDKPQMECNGMCHLTEELAKDQKQDPELIQNNIVINLYVVSETDLSQKPFIPVLQWENNFHYDSNLISRSTQPLSPPPLFDFI